MKVKISDVIVAVAFVNNETKYFYSIKTEELLMGWESIVNGKLI